MKILIVDDQEQNLHMLQALLSGNGYEVVFAANGAEALKAARESAPGMIISDILMPVMDGFTLCSEWRRDERLKEVPFIFYTATYTDPGDEKLALNLGADKFIVKPVAPDEFMKIIQDVVSDVDQGRIERRKPVAEQGKDVFKLYKESLVNKLGKKMLDLDQEVFKRKVAEEKTNHLNLALQAVQGIDKLIIAEKDMGRFILGACDSLTKTRGYYNVWIVLLDKAGRYVMSAESGLAKDFLPMIDLFKKGGFTICGKRALSRSEVLVTEDPMFACPDCPLSGEYGKRAAMAVRLEHEGTIFGLLSVSIPALSACDEGEKHLLLGIAGDIAFALNAIDIRQKHEKSEEALRESEEKYRTLIQSLTDFVFIVDIDGKFGYLNPEFEKLTGYPAQDFIGRYFTEILAPEYIESTLNHFKRGLSGEEIPIYAVEVRHKDGNKVPVELKVTSLLDSDGNTVGRIGIARDITDRKRAGEEKMKLESQLQQAQEMEAIGTLAGGIAHDFNNILGGIMGYAELAKMKTPEGSNVIAYLDKLIKSSTRAVDLIKQILTISRRHKKEQRPVQVRYIVNEALNLLRATLPTTIEIREDLAKDTGIVNADPTQMHQVIMNLGTNAGHAMQEDGGVLEVSLANVELDDLSASKHLDLTAGSYLRLRVSDTGYGIASEIMERIFDPYFTTKDTGEGTGLGLSVAQGIVKSHGGIITTYSEPGKGTTFNVYLPIMDEAEKAEKEESKEPLPTGSECILFIDDEQALVEIGSQMLERLGYEVVTKRSSVQALELFRTEPDRFDLVITDMTMPDMTGDKLAQELMKIRPQIPIILCTGHSRLVSEEKAKDIGIKAFVMKPLVMRNLAETVRKALGEGRLTKGEGRSEIGDRNVKSET